MTIVVILSVVAVVLIACAAGCFHVYRVAANRPGPESAEKVGKVVKRHSTLMRRDEYFFVFRESGKLYRVKLPMDKSRGFR